MVDLNEARRMARQHALAGDQIGVVLGRVLDENARLTQERDLAVAALLRIETAAREWEAEALRLRAALQDLYDDWPGPNTEALQAARAALAGPGGGAGGGET